MPMKEAVRTYHFDDAKLSTEASRIKSNAERDNKEFLTRKVDNTNLADLQTAIDDFTNYPTDEELQGDVTESTAAKDAIANNLRMMMRPIRNMADMQYGTGGKYKTFGFGGMDKLDDNNLYRQALRVVRVGTKLLSELAAQGLTEEMLTALSDEAAAFHKAMETQEDKIEDRDIATQERVLLGNALYERIVKLASVGKSLFEDNDEARYNDYVLYDEHTGDDEPLPPTP